MRSFLRMYLLPLSVTLQKCISQHAPLTCSSIAPLTCSSILLSREPQNILHDLDFTFLGLSRCAAIQRAVEPSFTSHCRCRPRVPVGGNARVDTETIEPVASERVRELRYTVRNVTYARCALAGPFGSLATRITSNVTPGSAL